MLENWWDIKVSCLVRVCTDSHHNFCCFLSNKLTMQLHCWFGVKIIDVSGNPTDPSFLSLVIEILCALC